MKMVKKKMKKKRILTLLCIVILFLFTRIFLLYSINTGTEPPAGEESGRVGAIGYQWLQGNPGHYFNIIFHSTAHHQLGIAIKGALAGLFFWLFGISWQSLMLSTVLEGLLLFLLLYFFLEKYFSYNAAILGSFLYIFSFPTWIMATTSQPATVLLGILCSFSLLYVFFKLHFKGRSCILIGLFGFLIGFSVFVQLFWSLLTLLSILIYLFLLIVTSNFQNKINLKKTVVFIVSLLVGISPFLYYHFYLYGGANTFTYKGEDIFTNIKPLTSSFHSLQELLNYFINSFGFYWPNFGDFGFLLNFIFFSTGILILCFLLYSLGIQNILRGKFRIPFRDEQTKIYLILLILILLNFSIFFLEPIKSEGWGETKLSPHPSYLQREFEYTSYLHFLFLLTLPIFYSKTRKWNSLVSIFPLILLILGIFASFFVFYSQTGNYIYSPVSGYDLKTLERSNRPSIYRMPHEIFGEFSITTVKGDPNAAEIPPFPRSLDDMREICAAHPNTKMCYKITGAYFAQIRRYDLSKSLTLCKRLNLNYFKNCREGVSWALGYYISYNKSLWRHCNSSDLNISYKGCLGGIKAGKEALQYDEILEANLTTESTRKIKKATRKYEKYEEIIRPLY